MNQAAAILAVLATLGVLMGAIRLLQTRRGLHPESARKLVHLSMGAVTLSFPWLFDSAWPVGILAAGATLALLAVKHFGPLRRAIGGVLHEVDRESSGEICFPVGVFAVFYLAAGNAVLYCIPILLLTVADALAALIGVRYGKSAFTTYAGGTKSVEGCVAFFVAAFFCTHVTLLLATPVGRLESLVIGLNIGLLIMLVELVSWRGLDNLFIPLSSFAMLYQIGSLPAQDIVLRLAVLCLLALFVAIWRRRATLDTSALIVAVLGGYVLWAIGGMKWLLPAAFCFASYAVLWPAVRNQQGQIHDLRAVLSICSVGLFWLLVQMQYPSFDWSYLGALAFAVQLALIGHATWDPVPSDALSWRPFTRCLLAGWLVPLVPYALIIGTDARSLLLLALSGPPIALALMFYSLRWRNLRADPFSTERWLTQSVAGIVGTLLGMPAWVYLEMQR